MIRNYQYRIYPTGKQERQMNLVFHTCQRIWNYFLAQKISAYKTDKKSISCFAQIKELPQLALNDDVLKEMYAQTLQDVPRRLDKAFQSFFRRIKSGETPGFPRFKAKDRYNSFTYPQNNGSFKLTEDGKIYLSKIGCVKIKLHREAKVNWKTCIVKRTCTGKWYVVICIEKEDITVKKSSNPAVGIDLGLKEFAVLSDGTKVKRERFFKAGEGILAKAQRKLAKQKRGSQERKKARLNVARIHERIANQRNDFTHKLSRRIANSYGVICVEGLNIPSMLGKKNVTINGIDCSARGTHRSIADVAWKQFTEQLKYKAEEAGSSVIVVNPKNTTKMCNACGKLTNKDLSDRIHTCRCGLVMDRDLNASKNILRLGLQSLAAIQKAA